MSAFDEQIGGNHYKLMMIQPTEYILANDIWDGVKQML